VVIEITGKLGIGLSHPPCY